MEKLRIEFQKDFRLDTDDQDGEACHCELTVVLPKNDEGKVVDLLRNRNKRLFGSVLSSCWGGWGTEVGKGSQVICATDWDKLSRLVDQKIEEIVNLLKEVKEGNEKLLAEKPEDESLIVEI